jgi:phage-related holin
MENYIQQYVALVNGVKLTLLMSLICANFLTGLAVSIKTGNFALKQLGQFMYSRVLAYAVAYLGVGVIGLVDTSWAWAVTATWALILATLVGAILQNLKELGINLPDSLGGGNQ